MHGDARASHQPPLVIKHRWWLLSSAGWLLLAACAPSPQTYDSSFLAMGTRVDLSLQANTPTQAAQLAADIERDMLRWGRDWYPWGEQPGELKQLNIALTKGESPRVSAELRELLIRAQTLQQASDGYFDPAVAPMVKAWGFTDMTRVAVEPSAAQLSAWTQNHPTLADLNISSAYISSPRRDLQLDLGAIAKGYAVDLALQQLRAGGIRHAALNIGGELRVMGGVRSKQVSIRDPRRDAALAMLDLNQDESISTSGDYERYAVVNGQRIHHLLDPHTGQPVAHTQAVTVLAADATLADAASTALMAAGPDNWRRIARQLGITQVLRIDGSGAIEVTAALYARLKWSEAALREHRISQITPHD